MENRNDIKKWILAILACVIISASIFAQEVVDVPTLTRISTDETGKVSRVARELRIQRRQLSNRNAQHTPQTNRAIDPIPDQPRVNMPRMSMADMQRLIDEAAVLVDGRLKNIEPNIFNSGIVQQQGSPAWFAAAMAKTKVAAKNFSRPALIAEEATRLVAKNFGLGKEEIIFGLPTADIRGTALSQICPLEVDFPCQPGKYRAYSAYCNNVQNPTWGNANTRYLRYLPPDYADGVSVPRLSVTSGDLPSGREVSLSVHGDSDRPHPHLTAILAIFGEFVSHDIAHNAQSAGFHGHRIKCCGVPQDKVHPECMPIRVPEDDPAYGRIGMTCMEYTRSCTAPRIACTLGPREQVNQVTSFLDGSTIYGSSAEEDNLLRTFRGGQLKTQKSQSGTELLPADEDSKDCRGGSGRKKCFMAGDVRVNENTPLMVMHTLWVREHNRIAKSLANINPHWKDNELFEEARRIVGAQIQHITYNELLPATLGRELMDKFDLQIQSSGHFMGYDINVNAGISNAVGSAVLSFIFSMMPSHFDLVTAQNDQLKKVGVRMMSETSFQPSDLYQGDKFDEYVMGMVSQKAQSRDEFITNEMTNNLFADPKTGLGADMAAMTIQQGRDHGIPSYIQWRKFCRLDPVISNFRDLRAIMTADSVEKLSNIYKDVADIDLFTGGLAEKPIIGAVVGPTFGCLLARQFHYLRKGDRFWYENDIPPSSFTKEQLAELRRSTLARVICNNANGIHFMQPSTFLLSDPFLNAYQSCDTADIPEVDLTKWQTASPVFKVPDEMLEESMVRAKRSLAELRQIEEESFINRIGVADNKSPQGTHLGFLRPKRMARIVSNQSMVLELASQGFADVFLNPAPISHHFRQKRDRENRRPPNNVHDLMNALPNVDVSDLLDLPKVLDCDDQVLPCDHTSRFRTMTGWCNNLNNPDWGKSIRSFNRIIPARYDDGMSSPRSRAVSGNALPSPRTVSTAVHYDVSVPHVRYSLMVMQWGQYLDHDLTFTPMNEGFGGTALNCKSCDSTRNVHPECLPIPIPKQDSFYPTTDNNGQAKCLHFVRSMAGQLKLGPREQLNQVTTFLDSSNIYGSDNCDGKVLRAFVGGRMNSTRNPNRGTMDMLPQTAFHKECRAPSRLCFEAGDNRASEQPALAAIHTVFLREHNRVADGLARINSHWNDEQLYQNARRIVSAIEQHISYNEFLPRVLGLNFLNRFGLRLETENYHNGYNPRCNPTMLNEFGSAAFRFGHSLIKPVLERYDRGYKLMSEPLLLRKGFFNSDMLMTVHAVDHIMRGLVTSSMETLDNTITQEVTNHLFEDSRIPFSGMDLASLNLQRGRDHGLAPYNDYRQACNLTRARNFDDLRNEIPQHLVERLKNIYEHVNDIDLFTGGLIETPLHGGLVGPTFGCILGIQFQLLRNCDRFWYETGNPLVRFTEAQLASIRKVSLAKVLCDNSDTIDTIQRQAMDLPDPFLNPRVACNSLPGLNFDLFKERVTCTVDRITIDVGNAERISPCVMCTCTKEGPICQSLKINNCFHLASSFSKEAILSDDVCKVQCAFSFRAFPQVDINTNNVLGFSNN